MAAGVTYTPIATSTISTQTSVTFSAIPGTYTDLILICNYVDQSTYDLKVRVNSDTGSNYSWTFLYGTGSTAGSFRSTNDTSGGLGDNSTSYATNITHFQNYSNTTTYKTILSRNGSAARDATASAILWRSTSAINAIQVYTNGGTGFTGTFTLYGVAAA
jgi:hypothetical protein